MQVFNLQNLQQKINKFRRDFVIYLKNPANAED